jgi:DNA-binding MarR family transcriptional regulator
MNPSQSAGRRAELEALLTADACALCAESDQIGRVFATAQQVQPSAFRALLNILVAEDAGQPMTSGELRQKMGVSAAAITYLVERMIDSGHIQRDSDPADRRKVILRIAGHGRDIAGTFFAALAAETRAAMADLSDTDLAASHRVLAALVEAMRRFQDALKPPKASQPQTRSDTGATATRLVPGER